MDDVRQVIRWGLVLTCLLDAISEAALRDSNSTRDTVIALVSVVALLANRRIGAAVTAIGLLFTLHTSHEFLVCSIAALVALFPSPRQLALLVRVQISAMWVLAALAKLHPAFRSGAILEGGEILLYGTLPIGLLVWGTILAEGLVLPLLLWTRPRIALWCTIAFQGSILVGMSTFRSDRSRVYQLSYVTALFSFGLLTMICVFAVTTFDRRTGDGPGASEPSPVGGRT